MVRKISFLVFVIFVIFNSPVLSAEDGSSASEAGRQPMPNCPNAKFEIESVNFQKPIARDNVVLLDNYVRCVSVVKRDINECAKLSADSELYEKCRKNYYFFVDFFSELAKHKKPNMPASLACSAKDCGKLEEAMIAKDPELCKKIKDKNGQSVCIALVNGDMNVCSGEDSSECTDFVLYKNAITQSNPSICASIGDDRKRIACMAYLGKNTAMCQDENFNKFVEIYCNE